MFAALVASIQKTDMPGDQVLEVLAACCLPQLLRHPQQMKIKLELSQVYDMHYIETDSSNVYFHIIATSLHYCCKRSWSFFYRSPTVHDRL